MKFGSRRLAACAAAVLLMLETAACGSGSDDKTWLQESEQYEDDYIWLPETSSFYPFEAGYSVTGLAANGSVMLLSGVKEGNIQLALLEYGTSLEKGVELQEPVRFALDSPDSKDENTVYCITADSRGDFLF